MNLWRKRGRGTRSPGRGCLRKVRFNLPRIKSLLKDPKLPWKAEEQLAIAHEKIEAQQKELEGKVEEVVKAE